MSVGALRLGAVSRILNGVAETYSSGGFRSALNFVDSLFLLWLGVISGLITIFHSRLPNWQVYILLHFACAWMILLLAGLARRSGAARFLHDWYPLALFIVNFEEVSRLSFLVVNQWRDPYILEFENRLFHTPPTVWLNRVASPGLTELMEIGYFSYFVLLMIVGGKLYSRPGKREFRQVMTASVLSYMVCYFFFILFPTEGPAYTLTHVHEGVLRGGIFHWLVLFIQRNAGVHGNAFPSSHVAAGMAALFFAWCYTPKLGAMLTPLVVLLCLGAVNDRYHYASDVVAGLGVGLLCSMLVLGSEQLSRTPQSSASKRSRILTQSQTEAFTSKT